MSEPERDPDAPPAIDSMITAMLPMVEGLNDVATALANVGFNGPQAFFLTYVTWARWMGYEHPPVAPGWLFSD